MPREVIQNPEPFQPFRLSIGWQRDQDVQVGIQVEDADLSVADILFRDLTQQEDLGRRLRDCGPIQPEDTDLDLGALVLTWLRETRDYVERDGVWVSLDRRQINEAIRHLRKARDTAYGRDE